MRHSSLPSRSSRCVVGTRVVYWGQLAVAALPSCLAARVEAYNTCLLRAGVVSVSVGHAPCSLREITAPPREKHPKRCPHHHRPQPCAASFSRSRSPRPRPRSTSACPAATQWSPTRPATMAPTTARAPAYKAILRFSAHGFAQMLALPFVRPRLDRDRDGLLSFFVRRWVPGGRRFDPLRLRQLLLHERGDVHRRRRGHRRGRRPA